MFYILYMCISYKTDFSVFAFKLKPTRHPTPATLYYYVYYYPYFINLFKETKETKQVR